MTDEKSNEEKIKKGQFLVRVVIEVLGSPKEHVDESILKVVDVITSKEDLEVVSEETFEATKVKDQDNMFTTFSEIEFWISDFHALTNFATEFMPSSIEIMEPETIFLKQNKLSDMFNDMLAKLHNVDMAVKSVAAANSVQNQNTTAIIKNFLTYILVNTPKTSEELAVITGIPKQNSEAFLEVLIQEGFIKKDNDLYSLTEKADDTKKKLSKS